MTDAGFMKCPRCNNSVLTGIATCQFCGEDLRGLAPVQKRSAFFDPDNHDVVHTGGRPHWAIPAYYSIASYFLLSGLISALLTAMKPSKLEIMNTVNYISSGISIIMGLGLLTKIEIIRGVVNFVCGLRVVFGLLSLPGSLMGLVGTGAMGFIFLLLNLLDIVLNGFMIYLIGETD